MILSSPSRLALLAGTGWLALSAVPAFAETVPGTASDSATDPSAQQQSGASAPDLPSNDQVEDVDATDFGTATGQIVVSAQRLRGQLDVEQAPLLELSEVDIAAEGVTSIAELVTQISNQTGSARGRV